MMSLNKVFLMGHLGSDVEVRYTPAGKAVANFSVATSEKAGETEATEWHKVILWEKQAELAAKYLAKGSRVHVEGKIKTRSWEKDGQKRYATEIIGHHFIALSKREESADKPAEQKSGWTPPAPGLDDIPF